LAEERGSWRLERHRPGATEPWPPATDHLLIEQVDDLEALRPALPEATTPVAAFEGRRSLFALTIDGEPVSMTMLDGNLRTVTAEQPASRLILEGSGAAVRTLTMSLAETLSLAVPEQSLATEAQRLADATVAKPRRSGAPALPPEGLSVQAAFNHIAGHLIGVMLQLAPKAADPASGPDPVHDMRVAVRRARSALSMFPQAGFPPAPLPHALLPQTPVSETPDAQAPFPQSGGPDGGSLARASDGLKHLGHMLGPARDWDVFMTETAPPVEAALPEHAALRSLLRSGARRRHQARAALGAYLKGPEFRLLCLEFACLVATEPAGSGATPPLVVQSLTEHAAGVLQTRWKKLVHAGKAFDDLEGAGLHRLRLKVKRLRYAAEFFAPLFPGKHTSRFIRRLAILQERLGSFNDTAVAEALLRDLNNTPGYAAGLVLGFTAARGARARPKIADAWVRLRRADPFWA
jgi:triphosphatase